MKFIILMTLAFNLKAALYEINKDHSRVQFEVDYMSLTKVEGQFKDYSGQFEFDSEQLVLKNVNAQINSNSVDTNEPKRDFHLKGHEFLFAANYPVIIFTSKSDVHVSKKNAVKVSGELQIRGIKKNVSGNLKYKGSIIDPWGKENLFFEYNLEVDRKEFGMKWNKELDKGGYLVGDNVAIKILIQAQKSGEKTAFSTHMIPSTKAIIERDQLKKGKIKKLTTTTDPNERKQ